MVKIRTMKQTRQILKFRITLLTGAIFSLLSLLWTSASLAEPVPTDLIPPDVTLSPRAGATTTTKSTKTSTGTNAPGLSGAGSQGEAPGLGRARFGGSNKLPATGITPSGSGNMFNGVNAAPNQGQPAATNAQTSAQPQGQDPVCVVDTNKGRIVIRLFRQFAPKTVEAFISMVNEGFYNGLTWHRHEPGFVIQGGCPKGNGTGLYMDPKTNQPRMLFLETSPSVRHNAAGVVAMAHFPKNPHSASCQFYITLQKQDRLDFKYTIFGGVVDGMDTVFKIRKGDKINSITMQN